MEYTDEQILEMYKKLPEDLRNAIFSVEMTGAVKGIGEKYQLPIDKIGALGNETGMVMLGVTHSRDFIVNLGNRLNVDKETARKIADEINTQIFSKVRESLKKIHEGEEAPTLRPEASEVGVPTPAGVGKDEILKEIEGEEAPTLGQAEDRGSDRSVGKVPEILQGMHEPTKPESSFELKTKEDIFRMPPEESKYPHGDPYREPIE
ncbi:hypothetical protein KKG15_03195 [Patescibacteria group bacterium]|nr:hypothetical protein [Patescibacteria group bacterium]